MSSPITKWRDITRGTVRELESSARLGDVEALEWLGAYYSDSDTPGRYQPLKALRYYRKAAHLGSAHGAWHVANALEYGLAGPVDLRAARRFYELAVTLGDRDAASSLDRLSDDPKVVFRWLENRAKAGDPDAMVQVGERYRVGDGVQSDADSARTWRKRAETEYRRRFDDFRLEAEEGSAEAMYWLGVYYEDGLGVRANPSNALKWFLAAEAKGKAEAAYRAAIIVEFGLAESPDADRAKKLYRRAVELGYAEAQDELDRLSDDPNIFYAWASRCARKGDPEAVFCLGYCYQEGKGTSRDLRKALMCYRRAAELGDSDGAYNAAMFYEEGEVSPPDLEKAERFYERALQLGDDSASDDLKRLRLL